MKSFKKILVLCAMVALTMLLAISLSVIVLELPRAVFVSVACLVGLAALRKVKL